MRVVSPLGVLLLFSSADLKVPRRPRKIFHVQLISVRQTGESYGFNADKVLLFYFPLSLSLSLFPSFTLFHCHQVNNSDQTFNFSLNSARLAFRIRAGNNVFDQYLSYFRCIVYFLFFFFFVLFKKYRVNNLSRYS